MGNLLVVWRVRCWLAVSLNDFQLARQIEARIRSLSDTARWITARVAAPEVVQYVRQKSPLALGGALLWRDTQSNTFELN